MQYKERMMNNRSNEDKVNSSLVVRKPESNQRTKTKEEVNNVPLDTGVRTGGEKQGAEEGVAISDHKGALEDGIKEVKEEGVVVEEEQQEEEEGEEGAEGDERVRELDADLIEEHVPEEPAA